MKVDLREFRAAYLAEVDEHLGGMRQRLVVLDDGLRSGRTCGRELRDLLRLAHTIKGLSAMVGIDPIVAITHRLENVLRSAEQAGGRLSARELEVLVDGTAAVEVRVKAVAADAPVPAPPAALLAELDAIEASAEPRSIQGASSIDPEIDAKLSASEREQLVSGAASGKRALRVDFTPTRERAGEGITITTVRERVALIAEIVKIVPMSGPPGEGSGVVFALLLLTDADDDVLVTAAGTSVDKLRVLIGPPPPALDGGDALPLDEALDEHLPVPVADLDAPDEHVATGVLRVDVARVDDALEKLSALIVTRSRLKRAAAVLAAAGAPTRELEAILADHARQLRDLRGSILRVRMVAMSAVLDRLPLLVRSLGRTTGKSVRLTVTGGDAELDKTVAERLFPALVHLLRNAVDHGIEPSEERVRLGKPPAGMIHVSCVNDANRTVEIRIRDDGRGIDRARVARRANGTDELDDASLLDYICRPGFSTRDEVNLTSGRGVGMDVVKRIIVSGLGGLLSVETSAGGGTLFILRVPLTITIVDAFMVRCGAQRFAIPVPIVEEIVEIDPSRLLAGPRSGGRRTDILVRRGESVPIFDLNALLSRDAEGSTRREPGVMGGHALIVRSERRSPVAFAVDRVLGQQEAVVRPLVDPLVNVGGVSGSTDLGDGIATLVLDLVGLSTAATTEAA